MPMHHVHEPENLPRPGSDPCLTWRPWEAVGMSRLHAEACVRTRARECRFARGGEGRG